MSRGSSLLRQAATRSLVVLAGALIGLGLGEVGIGHLTREDEDGNRYVRSVRIPPYRVPARRLAELLRAYHSGPSGYVVYSPDLGWESRSEAGDPTGGSGSVPPRPAGDPGADAARESGRDTLRIALFGDSFTAGSGPGEGSWGSLLESGLRAHGIRARVSNFGVGGYGLDQAYLRWRKRGRSAAPDLVLLGFQPENVKRDLNLIRLLYVADSGLPFSKPRFLLEGDRLRLVNVPAAPPESLPGILARLGAWPLARHERFLPTAGRWDRLWLRSRALAFAATLLGGSGGWTVAGERAYYDPGREGGALALAIVRRFENEVTAAGAGFAIVHLPRIEDLRRLESGRGLAYSELLATLALRHRVIETSGALGRAARERGYRALFGGGSHYASAANRIVADAVVAALLESRPGVRGAASPAHRRP